MVLPRLLVIDDLFGRNVPDGLNTDRENLCAHFLWQDVSDDAAARASRQKVLKPTAEVFFCRAQTPASAEIGDFVENNPGLAIETVRRGWKSPSKSSRSGSAVLWSMVLIDLCFYTGRVTALSHQQTSGMAEGRPRDDKPESYFGLTLLDAIHREFPELPIFMLSSKPRDEVSLEFSRRGALGFIDRSALDGPELLQQALWNHGLLPDEEGDIVGRSLPILFALREARRSAGHRENVLIRGERGSGKELIANYIHRHATRCLRSRKEIPASPDPKIGETTAPLVTVNSAVFTPNLFASELFGIESRTATGVDGKIGLIEMARRGELFLDEIADMPTEIQAAMLRVLQERQITRVGARKPKEVDVRFLSATNVDLEDPERRFREDLLDRLRTGGTIWVPPLRDRREDIPLLAEKFVLDAEGLRPGTHSRTITNEARQSLMAHDWPGNVRELRSVIFDAVTRHPDVEHLVPAHLRFGKTARSLTESRNPTQTISTMNHVASPDLDFLLDQVRRCEFPPTESGIWAGRLPDLQREQARLVSRLLAAALEATLRRTPENPEGVIRIHPAAKLAIGDKNLTATEAADLFKRLLGPLADELEGDLFAAYETALRLRPKGRPVKTREITSGR